MELDTPGERLLLTFFQDGGPENDDNDSHRHAKGGVYAFEEER